MSKSKVATKTMKDPELIEMFNQMTGVGEPDIDIITPKYEKLIECGKSYINLLIKFVKSPIGSLPEFNNSFVSMVQFIQKAQGEFESLMLKPRETKALHGSELEKINKNPELLEKYMREIPSKYEVSELSKYYLKLKDCLLVQDMVMTLKNLKNLLNMEKERTQNPVDNLTDPLSDKFITRADGFDVIIFNFTNLNFKAIFNLQNNEMKNYVLLFLKLIKKNCEEAFKIVTAPDIDVEKFSKVLINSIKDIRKHIPRCDKAFDKIEESVSLLQKNFDGYYKDFIQSQNPGIIIENFVLDVANDAQADAQTTAQFREIIKFYKKNMTAKKINDPKVQKLFSMLGENLDVLERKTGDEKQSTKAGNKKDKKDKNNQKTNNSNNEETKKQNAQSFLPDNLRKK